MAVVDVERPMTSRELAAKIQVNARTVRRWFRGQAKVPAGLIERLGPYLHRCPPLRLEQETDRLFSASRRSRDLWRCRRRLFARSRSSRAAAATYGPMVNPEAYGLLASTEEKPVVG